MCRRCADAWGRDKSFDLDNSDSFWQSHRSSPFPEVATDIEEELKSYRKAHDEVTRMRSALGIDGDAAAADDAAVDQATRHLTSAVRQGATRCIRRAMG